ncbi:MAG TPA: aminotransferase class I/II-fold pyridoxal phosphate-dependent enzyme [Vicinamibacterales bacterium]|nr:aminotransferase class I/II-fold pyridoxal phosphate-dependent enzyme [Vicinamibacterales bacterium]HOQ59525.1 aminotransferase class I/II-fold pyridoxal phosphate-dependent enzyme [Vicinamibacterales bacterium]
MRLPLFAMERMQSTWENLVDYNLSESGVRPMRVEELLDSDADRAAFFAQELAYNQSNGTIALRERIAAMYPGATIEHVEVTNGGSEANFVSMWHLVRPGDEVVSMVPNYGQTLGLAEGFGGALKPWPLRLSEDGRRWLADLDGLRGLVTPKTRLIVLCNPNNPTGARVPAGDLDEICRIAGRVGAWVLSDEIYRGAELDGAETPSVWGRYERVVVTSGLSKAYGLPGLRVGWIVSAPEVVASTWSRHDYTTIAPGTLSDRLARLALEPPTRAKILARTRGILHANLPVIAGWLDARKDRFSYVPPEAGAIVYTRYRGGMNSTGLVERLRVEKSVLIVPGDHFGMDGHLRIGFGGETRGLRDGLDRLADLLQSLPLAGGA